MSTIKIPIAASRPATPSSGEQVIFADPDKSGNLSTVSGTGEVVDLTEASNALFNSSTTVTQFKVNEFNRTLTSAELLAGNHDGFTKPENGIELLPAPAAGKCYIIAMDAMFAQWISNGNWGYAPEPYGEYRTLDIYYPNQSGAKEEDNPLIFSFPLMAAPYSDWIDRVRSDQYGKGTSTAFLRYDPDDSLGIDQRGDQTLYQRQFQNAQASGYGNWTIIKQGILAGINGKLVKQLAQTDGEIKIRFWYAELDLSDIVTSYPIQNPLPDYALTYKKAMSVDFYFAGLNFLDNPQLELPLSYWDHYPRYENSPNLDPEDFATQYRATRDSYVKSQNEYVLAADAGSDGVTISPGLTIMPKTNVYTAPLPSPDYGLNYDKIPAMGGPDYTFWGFPIERKRMRAQESSIEWPPFSGYRKSILPYDVEEGTQILTGVYDSGTWSDFVFDTTCGRVASFTIDNPGTGYIVGDRIECLGGSSPGGATSFFDAQAIITQVGSGGEIEEISFIDKGGHDIFGGQFYTAVPTVSITSGAGVDAVLTPVIETGQWILTDDYIRTTSFGDTMTLDELDSEFRASRDAQFKAVFEWTLATMPFILANLQLPGFQIEKYKL